MLDSVMKAEDILHQKRLNKEYLPIDVGAMMLLAMSFLIEM